MSDFGLQSSGLEIPSFEEWRDIYFNLARQSFGSDVSIGTNSILGELLSIPCYQDIQIWQALGAVYASQTLDGAEGIYLDEILARRGVFRSGAERGTGFAYVNTNRGASWTYTVNPATTFSATNGKNYTSTISTQLRDRISAYKLTRSEAQSITNSITFSVVNTRTGSLNSQTFDTTLTSFLSSLAAFINQNIETSETFKVFVQDNTLYVGFDSVDLISPVGLTTTTRFYANLNLGEKWSNIPVQCQEYGINIVNIGEIVGVTPTPNGYISTGNFTSFYAGSNVETDAQYRERFNSTVDEANAATRPAIFKAVSDLEGVSKVKLYDNPTSTATPEADPFTFNTVVLGGTTEEIANTIYQKKPINTLTDGSVSYSILTEDGGVEVIKYTPAIEKPYSIKVRYKTVNDLPLTMEQQDNIRNSFLTLQASFTFGGKIFNSQLESVVFGSIPFGLLSILEVLSKLSVNPDTSFSSADIVVGFDQLVTLSTENIIFDQLV